MKPGQLLLQGGLDFSVEEPVIDVNGFDNDEATASRLEAGDRKR
jgi:hypothetical protein